MALHRGSVSIVLLALSLTLAAPGIAVRAESRRAEKVTGYAEWRTAGLIIVDGQRIRVTESTRLKLKGVSDVASIPLGYEVEAEGTRDADGVLIADRVEAKPNGQAMWEREVLTATDKAEAQWLSARVMTRPGGNGKVIESRVIESGPQVDRVRRITNRLLPPYVERERVRVYVVEQDTWNASAMGNGAIWVHTGLLNDMDDDEMAIILGHELTHFTHEHTRRQARRGMWANMAGAVAAGVAEEMSASKGEALATAAGLTLSAWTNGYGRDMEDQADRVGLRYAYQAGYDVRRGPRVWQRFREKHGQESGLKNFFFSEHSLAEARERNLAREIQLNYVNAAPRTPVR